MRRSKSTSIGRRQCAERRNRHLSILFRFGFGLTTSPFQVVSDLSKFQSLCEEVIDLDHLRESGGKHVRVRPQFHAELQRLGEELSGTSEEMLEILKEVEEASKVCMAGTEHDSEL